MGGRKRRVEKRGERSQDQKGRGVMKRQKNRKKRKSEKKHFFMTVWGNDGNHWWIFLQLHMFTVWCTISHRVLREKNPIKNHAAENRGLRVCSPQTNTPQRHQTSLRPNPLRPGVCRAQIPHKLPLMLKSPSPTSATGRIKQTNLKTCGM